MRQFQKKISFIVFLTVNTCTALPSDGQLKMDSVEKWIIQINADYATINSDTTKFTKTEKDIFGQSSEGGLLKMYHEGGIVRKAILTLYGENGQVTNEYYLVNGQLIFLFQKGMRYKRPINEGRTEIQGQDEDRFYFRNKKLIRWYTTDNRIVNSSLYPAKEKEILSDMKLLN
jgi:hypothetical protein